MAKERSPTRSTGSATLITILVVVAVLYVARTVLIPLTLAVLLAFMLAPLVIRLRHWGLGRVSSAVTVVLLAFVILGVIGALMASQLTDLAHRLPAYQETIHQKLQTIRSSGGGFISRVSRELSTLADELTLPAGGGNRPQTPEEKPVPVEIRHSNFSPLEFIQKLLGSVLSTVLTAGIVVVFALFMLIEQEELRDRLIRLAGARRVNMTTQVMDDAAYRVSRYLVAQLVINVGYGVLVGIGLYFIRVPNPLLWGISAALLRYIPYLGIWIAAVMPAAIAFAVEPGWVKVPVVVGMYAGIDLLTYNLVEPWLYGTSTGVSPLAILVAAVFWTWLWGPVGLLLATPLTVCVAVVGRHVPSLSFLQILLSDEPGLPPKTRYYQRMLAMDLVEATEVAESFLKGKSLEELYDTVLVPALRLAEEDRHRGELGNPQQQFLLQNTRLLVQDLGERAEADSKTNRSNAETPRGTSAADAPLEGPNVLCIPARDEADEIAAMMLAQLLERRGFTAKVVSSATLAGEAVAEMAENPPHLACILAVPPFGYVHARYLCRRFRAHFCELKLVGAILTGDDSDELKRRRPGLPVDELASSLKQALAQIPPLLAVKAGAAPQPALQT